MCGQFISALPSCFSLIVIIGIFFSLLFRQSSYFPFFVSLPSLSLYLSSYEPIHPSFTLPSPPSLTLIPSRTSMLTPMPIPTPTPNSLSRTPRSTTSLSRTSILQSKVQRIRKIELLPLLTGTIISHLHSPPPEPEEAQFKIHPVAHSYTRSTVVTAPIPIPRKKFEIP